MCISQQFVYYIINRNLISKINVISCLHIPKLKSVNFSFVLPYDFELENLNFLKVLLFIEYLTGQRCSLVRIGKRLDGRITRFLTYGVTTLRKKNLFTFFSNVRLFMANSKISIENGPKTGLDPKSTKIKIELDILKASPHLPMALKSLNFKFFIEIEFVGNYEGIKLLLSGLTIII
jgi:hypothetical protein